MVTRLILAAACLVCIPATLAAQAPFVTTWKTDNPGVSGPSQITIPTFGPDYDYTVYWEDVADASVNGTAGPFTGDATITFPEPGTYRIEISGDFPHIFFNGGGDREKILTIEQWGDIAWRSMANAFWGATNLTSNATDAPDLSRVTSMTTMFAFASSFSGNIGGWDVSNVTNMLAVFVGASAFNQPIGGWDVSNVTTMQAMFEGASSFDQDLGGWDVRNVASMNNMLAGSGLSRDNYDATLTGWAELPVRGGVILGATGLTYCHANEARQSLIDSHGWTIMGDALDCPPVPELAIAVELSEPDPVAGDTIEIVTTLENRGTGPAADVLVAAAPDADRFEIVDVIAGQGTYDGAQGRWDAGTVQPGAAVTLTLRVVVRAPAPDVVPPQAGPPAPVPVRRPGS